MAELNLVKTQEKNSVMSLSADTIVTHDVNEEFSLPDYVPEIRRLLNVKAQVLPESKYISDKGEHSFLEFGGVVTYLLIYTDDEGKLYSLPLTSNYEAESALTSHPSTVLIDTSIDSVIPRVTAPRKITIKSRLKSRIAGWENREYSENIEGKSVSDEMFTERKTEEIKAVSLSQISMQNIRISDKLDMQGMTNPRPLSCDATVYVTDTKAQNNTVSVRGEIKIKCLCNVESGYITLTKSIPLAEELESSGASLGDFVRVGARCVSLSISNEQNDESGQLFFDLNCELEGEILRNCDTELTKDCYSTKFETEETYKTVDIYSVAKANNDSFSLNENVKRKSTDITEIIDVINDPVCEKAEFKNGKCLLLGKVNLTVIGLGEEKEDSIRECIAENYEIPFKYATDIAKTSGEYMARWDIYAGDVNVRLDGDKISIGMELYPNYEIIEKKKMQILDTSLIKRDKEIKKDLSCVRVCFPNENSTLWEIAKKYHITVSSLKENNDLSSDSLDGVKSLII